MIVEPDPGAGPGRGLALDGELLVVCGSIYLLGDVGQRLTERFERAGAGGRDIEPRALAAATSAGRRAGTARTARGCGRAPRRDPGVLGGAQDLGDEVADAVHLGLASCRGW